MRTDLVTKFLPEELLHNRSNLDTVLKDMDTPPLAEEEREELRKHVIDCEWCGMWCSPEDILQSNGGEEICEECKGKEE